MFCSFLEVEQFASISRIVDMCLDQSIIVISNHKIIAQILQLLGQIKRYYLL